MGKLGNWLGTTASKPLRAIWRRFWWVFVLAGLVLLIIVLGMFQPIISAFGGGLQMVFELLETLGQTTVGRLVLVLLGLGITVFVSWRMLRRRLRTLWGRMDLGRHLRAVASLLGDDQRRAGN